MRIVRLLKDGTPRWGTLRGEQVNLFSGAPYAGGAPTGEMIPRVRAEWLAPCAPSKIVCVGRNYAAHARELGNEVPTEPLLFLKPPSALLPPGGVVELPGESSRVDYEGEIGLVIGEATRKIQPEQAWECIYGVTGCNDVTARDLQRLDKTFTRGKGFDTFAPCGPWLETDFNPDALHVTTTVNGVRRQDAGMEKMIFSPSVVLAYISNIMTLHPGDLVMMGTPEGVGALSDGDRVEIEVSGVGVLRHSVKAMGN